MIKTDQTAGPSREEEDFHVLDFVELVDVGLPVLVLHRPVQPRKPETLKSRNRRSANLIKLFTLTLSEPVFTRASAASLQTIIYFNGQ